MDDSFAIFIDLDEVEELLHWKPGAKSSIQYDEKFIQWVVQEFIRRFRAAIRDQRWGRARDFDAVYFPLSAPWSTWKRRHHFKVGFWQCTGQIQRNIEAVRLGNRTWRIGWNHGRSYQDPRTGRFSGVRIWQIVRWLEFGTKSTKSGKELIPPRPLIRPIMRNMKKEVTRLYLEYLSAKHVLTPQEIREYMQERGIRE